MKLVSFTPSCADFTVDDWWCSVNIVAVLAKFVCDAIKASLGEIRHSAQHSYIKRVFMQAGQTSSDEVSSDNLSSLTRECLYKGETDCL